MYVLIITMAIDSIPYVSVGYTISWEEEGTSSWGCSVASAAGVQSLLGGSGGMPPQENLQK